jgi:hypothetical protein
MDKSINYNRPFGIKLIAVVNGIAAVLHLVFWVLAFFYLSKLPTPTEIAERATLATTFGFGIADIIWSVMFLAVGSINLWNMKQTGWLAAQVANVLYWYSFTVILTKDIVTTSVSPGTLLFLPFAIFSVWVAYYLWKIRDSIFIKST